MANITFKLLKKEELVKHPVSGSVRFIIEYNISDKMQGDLIKGIIGVVVNENGIFPDLVQLKESVNSEIRSSLVIKLKECVKALV